eukprot:TRINITY_DN10125_c0_g1_i9.p2 TRINITY_DN10125_c0_g1~~TRINITY_DN10125_c0_g1_i9.p2  ORF type:complete len:158 (-),score=5.60 TRINITY_DN10125_c0_g1_i9:128-601(-)
MITFNDNYIPSSSGALIRQCQGQIVIMAPTLLNGIRSMLTMVAKFQLPLYATCVLVPAPSSIKRQCIPNRHLLTRLHFEASILRRGEEKADSRAKPKVTNMLPNCFDGQDFFLVHCIQLKVCLIRLKEQIVIHSNIPHIVCRYGCHCKAANLYDQVS